MKPTIVTEEKVFAYIKEYGMLEPGDKVIAGVSGGADSVCLLFVLLAWAKESPLDLAVVHVNHGLRPDAGEDEAYVEEICEKLGLPFFPFHADVRRRAGEEKLSEEEAGRIIRYEAFDRAAERFGANKIAVAHNANDQAETMLFHLFRGTGPAGLCGIRPVRDRVIRPLLCLERAEIEDYLRDKDIPFRTDSTNDSDDYARNRIRHQILPVAAGVSQGCVRHMLQTSSLLAEEEAYLAEQTAEARRRCVTEAAPESGSGRSTEEAPESGSGRSTEAAPESGSGRLTEAAPESGSGRSTEEAPEAGNGRKADCCTAAGEPGGFRIMVSAFLQQPPVLQKRLLLELVQELSPKRRDISFVHISALLTLFLCGGSREIYLPFGIRGRRRYGEVLLVTEGKEPAKKGLSEKALSGQLRKKPPDGFAADMSINVEEIPSGGLTVSVPGLGELVFRVFSHKKGEDIPQNRYTKWFDCDKIVKSLMLRTRCKGDFLTIKGSHGMCHKSLKDYMINEKILAEDRERLPLLAEESHVLWVVGHRISEYYKINENTKHVLQVQLKGSPADGVTEEKDGGAYQSTVVGKRGG